MFLEHLHIFDVLSSYFWEGFDQVPLGWKVGLLAGLCMLIKISDYWYGMMLLSWVHSLPGEKVYRKGETSSVR